MKLTAAQESSQGGTESRFISLTLEAEDAKQEVYLGTLFRFWKYGGKSDLRPNKGCSTATELIINPDGDASSHW